MPSMGYRPSQRRVRPTSALPAGLPFSYSGPHSSSPEQGRTFVVTPRPAENTVYKALMALASRPAYGVTLALAGIVARSWQVRGLRCLPLFGLDAETTYGVLSVHFPGIGRMMSVSWDELAAPLVFEEAHGLNDLVEMLVQYRTVLDEDSTWLAHAVVTGCLGREELWREMNLPTATVLHDLLHDFFTVLAVRNRNGLLWKRFFLQELSARAERRLLCMPACGPLPEYARCLGD